MPPRPIALSLLSWNTLLVPGWIAKWRFPQLHNTTQPTRYTLPTRAGMIAESASKHDLVLLQEVWGVQYDQLGQRLRRAGLAVPPVLDARQLSAHVPAVARGWLESIWTYWYAHGAAMGGLYLASKSVFPLRSYRVHRFQHSETASRKGIAVAEVDVSAAHWTSVRRLLVFNTHLDVGPGTAEDLVHRKGGSQQLRQLTELKEVITRELEQRFGRLAEEHSSTTTASNTDVQVDARDTAVILVGDYNVIAQPDDPHSAYHRHLLPLRENADAKENDHGVLRDLYQQPHPPTSTGSAAAPSHRTECASYDATRNQLASDHEASGRIDYVFTIDRWRLADGRWVELAPLSAADVHVVRQNADEVASDHFPVVAKVVPSADYAAVFTSS